MKLALVLSSILWVSATAFIAQSPSSSRSITTALGLSASWDGRFANDDLSSVGSAAARPHKTAVIAGATGYIGKSTVREAVRQGYKTYALVRDVSKVTSDEGQRSYGDFFEGAQVVQVDVSNAEALTRKMQEITRENGGRPIGTIVSCMASRSGIKKDAYAIDYQATLNCLEAGRAVGARHFTLLSAFCVKNPWLQFQHAKLKMEAALQEQNDLTYTIVRPTAFFKSVSGQLEVVKSGGAYVMFGDGEITRCNPIAESELAQYLMDSATDPTRHNRIINLGGPDNAITPKMQAAMLFDITGRGEPQYTQVPVWIFDAVINTLQFLADLTGSEKLENAAETGRIGKYYAVEDMLTTKPEEKFGKITLREHYERIAVEGQEYDPYTTMIHRARGYDVKKMREESLSLAQNATMVEGLIPEKVPV